ncbi:MAG: helix-turn-helix transcriptional regulator [Clostridia bacterium]|nr:helix-turn-helix transcriptional regulator [Clostridia bacterium]
MQYNPRAIGQTIRNIRKEKGLSQDVLSGLAGIGRTHLTMIEAGSKAANMETLMKLSDAMDMKLSELVQRYESEAEESDENEL